MHPRMSRLSCADVGGYVSPAVAASYFQTGFHHIEVHGVVVVTGAAAVGLQPVEESLHIDIRAAAGRQVALSRGAVWNERIDVVAGGGIITFPQIEGRPDCRTDCRRRNYTKQSFPARCWY